MNTRRRKATPDPDTPHKNIKAILIWILAGTFALLAVAYLPDMIGWLALAGMILVVPLDHWQEILSRYLQRKRKVIVVLFLITLILGTTLSPKSPVSAVLPNTDTSTVDQLTTAETIAPPFTSEPATPITVPDSTHTATPTINPATETETEETAALPAVSATVSAVCPSDSTETTIANTEPSPTTAPQPLPTDETLSQSGETEPPPEMVWVSKTGSKYHKNADCSNMKNPSLVTITEAVSRGLTPCKKCY